jgi:hypothetical protein
MFSNRSPEAVSARPRCRPPGFGVEGDASHRGLGDIRLTFQRVCPPRLLRTCLDAVGGLDRTVLLA